MITDCLGSFGRGQLATFGDVREARAREDAAGDAQEDVRVRPGANERTRRVRESGRGSGRAQLLDCTRAVAGNTATHPGFAEFQGNSKRKSKIEFT